MASRQNRTWINWIVIGAITISLVGASYFLLRPDIEGQLGTDQEKLELSNDENQQISYLSNKPLKEAINLLAKQYGVTITLDNPYMENCPFPTLQPIKKSLQEILLLLRKQFKMELHEVTPEEYILIGGTCK